jgi:hypothetical protein
LSSLLLHHHTYRLVTPRAGHNKLISGLQVRHGFSFRLFELRITGLAEDGLERRGGWVLYWKRPLCTLR